MGFIQFFGALFFFVWVASTVFWGFAGAVYATQRGVSMRIALPVAAVFHWLGLLGLWLFDLVKRQNEQASVHFPSSRGGEDLQSWNLQGQSVGRASDPFGPDASGSLGPQPAGYVQPVGYGFGGVGGYPSGRLWIKSPLGTTAFICGIGVVVAFVVSLFLTWFNVITPERQQASISGFSTGFDFWVFISIGLVLVAVGLSVKHPSLVSAVLFALVGSWWLQLSMASLTARDVFVPAVDKLFQIPNLMTNVTGYSQTWAYDVGSAWYLVFLNSVILFGVSALIIYSSRKRHR